jgi:hypothetical protein
MGSFFHIGVIALHMLIVEYMVYPTDEDVAIYIASILGDPSAKTSIVSASLLTGEIAISFWKIWLEQLQQKNETPLTAIFSLINPMKLSLMQVVDFFGLVDFKCLVHTMICEHSVCQDFNCPFLGLIGKKFTTEMMIENFLWAYRKVYPNVHYLQVLYHRKCFPMLYDAINTFFLNKGIRDFSNENNLLYVNTVRTLITTVGFDSSFWRVYFSLGNKVVDISNQYNRKYLQFKEINTELVNMLVHTLPKVHLIDFKNSDNFLKLATTVEPSVQKNVQKEGQTPPQAKTEDDAVLQAQLKHLRVMEEKIKKTEEENAKKIAKEKAEKKAKNDASKKKAVEEILKKEQAEYGLRKKK